MNKRPYFMTYTRAVENQVPFRNCSCPDYDECLSAAAFLDVLLECTYCPNRDRSIVELRPDFFEIRGCTIS